MNLEQNLQNGAGELGYVQKLLALRERLRVEVMSWPVISVWTWTQEGTKKWQAVRVLKAALLPEEDLRPIHNGIGFWGWLQPEGLGDKSDEWIMHGQAPAGRRGGRGEWGKVQMPRLWDGQIEQDLRSSTSGARVLVGKIRGGNDDLLWMAPCEPSSQPEWPKLTKGDLGVRPAKDTRLVGVLWRALQVAPTRGEFLVAWGNRKGEFIGWEIYQDMERVRSEAARVASAGPTETGTVSLYPMPLFERFGRELRESSWGREI